MADERTGDAEPARPPRAIAASATSGDPFWWRVGFALLSILLAAAAPLTAAIHGAYTKSREIEVAREDKAAEMTMARQKEDYALRLQFLDRVVDPKYPAKDRQIILRFLSSAISDPDVKRWANDERKSVEREVADLEKSLATAQKQAQDAEDRLAGLRRTSANDKRALASATADLAEQMKQTEKLKRRLSSVWPRPLECAGGAIALHMGGTPPTTEETAACNEGPTPSADATKDQLQIIWDIDIGKRLVFCACTNAHPFDHKPDPNKSK
jgi:uncharacterized coiled-coil protein SlyX